MRARESVERGALCSLRRYNVNTWEKIPGRDMNRFHKQKEWAEKPKSLVLILEGCLSSAEFLFSNRKDALVVTKGLPEIPTFREPETLRVNWRAAAEVLGTLGWLPVVTERRERLRERRHLGNCCASLEGDSSF